ncbi:MAG: DUF5666 domain-containing protein [bacterium]
MERFRVLFFSFIVLVAFTFSQNIVELGAQTSFMLSKNADFSTDDRVFDVNDTLHVKITAPSIDFLDIDKNEFELQADRGGDKFEGSFNNSLNTIYTAELPLQTLNSSETGWRLKARIRDRSGHEFRTEVEISISNGVKREEVDIKGSIELLGSDFLVVKGTKILVDAATLITDQNGTILALSDLSPGENVEVKAVQQDNGDLLALSIEVKGRQKGEVVVKGRIDSLGADYLAVLGRKFFVDANTAIFDKDDNELAFADLTVGLSVKVHATPRPDNTLLATKIEVKDKNDSEVELTGFVEAVGDTDLVVSGVRFVVNSDTEILDNQENPIGLGDLKVGALVQIKAEQQADGTLLATQIKLEDEVPGRNEVEITGDVREVGDDFIVVSDFTFVVDENTVILDDDKRPIELKDLQVGFVVEVKATVQSDGSLLANLIKIEDRFQNEIEITGRIEALGDTTLQVNGLTFVVDDSTEILDNDKNPIAFSDLQVGFTVEIKAEILADGTRLATRIKIEDRDENEIELTGTIEDLGADSVTVSGVTFLVDANTEILDNKKNPILFTDLAVGQIVEIKGVLQSDGSILATKIKVEDRLEDEVELRGAIEALTDTTITVLGTTFNVTENTVVLDDNKNPISFGDLSVGQIVEVRGEILAGGTLVALRIKVENNNQNELQVKGPIDTLRASSLFVLGIEFQVDSNTQILGKKNEPISFADLMLGQIVEIRALKRTDGSALATRIKVEDASVISGTVSNIASNSFAILDANLLTDANTLVLGTQNLPLSFESLVVGQAVTASATKLADGTLLVSKIKVLNSGTVTGIADSGGDSPQPREFVLQQNYPNPFNPSTTITFKLPVSTAGKTQVSLVVYNLLGQAVRSLVNQPLQPGSHTIQWDSKDDLGNPVPSGIYFYQIKAGRFTETRRMTLLK